jgi:hypothetical protein
MQPNAGKFWCNVWRRMTPYADGRWGNIEMVPPDADADWTVVINFLLPPELDPDGVLELDRSRAVLVQTEPACVRHKNNTWGEYADPENIGFAATWTIREHHFPVDWYLRATYSALYTTNPHYDRFRVLSACQTWKQKYPGHKLRTAFVANHLQKLPYFDLFGTDLPIPHLPHSEMRAKDKCLFPYKYHFCAENSWEQNYFSEKLTDAFLAYCLPLYWGCPNAEEFFPPESFVRLPLEEPEHALEIVKKTIADGEWRKRLPAIREARRLVMDRYQAWPVIEHMIANL